MFVRHQGQSLLRRLQENRRFLQVMLGPRQVGKTTLARQLAEQLDLPSRYVSADEPSLKDSTWLEQQWEAGRALCRRPGEPQRPALLILDEAQKLAHWSETVKRLWDEDSATGLPLQVLVLGSSALLVQRGLSESMAGRFEVVPLSHWSYAEMRDAFGFDLPQYLRFGGYPGAASLVQDPERWTRYIRDALIEPAIGRDVLMMARVDKPALLRRVFELSCAHSGQVIAYQKMLGQLQDAGNATTIAHYLDLLGAAGLVTGLQKHAGNLPRRRGSSPKLLALNTALMTAMGGLEHFTGPGAGDAWGRLVETAVGAWLVNEGGSRDIVTRYWAGSNREVDFVIARGDAAVAIEVKSGRRRDRLPGMAALSGTHAIRRKLLVGADGIPLDVFLRTPPDAWFDSDAALP
ncbi:MAG: ATP-binding protein [Candidatus Krumholzibacteriia bacterium]|nr:ATP-binding protein [bacterium]MCB9513916.1 ATP-binding protein [Candidatus Latescibacterota bacterium]MCB9517083.1 ATP-binding protein [Candidatus Latescibacterota bacterium]